MGVEGWKDAFKHREGVQLCPMLCCGCWHCSWEVNHGAFGLVMEIDGLDTRDAFGAFVFVIFRGERMDLEVGSVPLEILFVVRDCRCEPCDRVEKGLEDGGGGRSNLNDWDGCLSAIVEGTSHGAVAEADVVFKIVEVGEGGGGGGGSKVGTQLLVYGIRNCWCMESCRWIRPRLFLMARAGIPPTTPIALALGLLHAGI